MKNKYAGKCAGCGAEVAPGAGFVERDSGSWITCCADCGNKFVAHARRLLDDCRARLEQEKEDLDRALGYGNENLIKARKEAVSSREAWAERYQAIFDAIKAIPGDKFLERSRVFGCKWFELPGRCVFEIADPFMRQNSPRAAEAWKELTGQETLSAEVASKR